MSSDTKTLGVYLYGSLVGWMWNRENYSWFEFSSEYKDDPNRSVLGLSFEERLHARFAANLRVPPWFSNLLPEGVLREWIAHDRKVSREREVELLIQVGSDLPGAVSVRPIWLDDVLEPEEVYEPKQLREYTDGKWKFSLAGVGMKFSMLKSADRFTCPASGAGGEWIVKLPDPVFPSLPLNEFQMMKFATLVDVDVPDIRLVNRDEIDDLPENVWRGGENVAFAIRRFDRDLGKVVHIEDLAQVRGVYPVSKYEGTFETVAGLFYRGHDASALIEFTKRMVFNILIGNGDAHLKNWSLIYHNRRSPTISPAYDIVATEIYKPSGEIEDSGLRFGGSRRFETMRIDNFDRLERLLGCQLHLKDVAVETIGRVQEFWPLIADELGDFPSLREVVGAGIESRSRSLMSK